LIKIAVTVCNQYTYPYQYFSTLSVIVLK